MANFIEEAIEKDLATGVCQTVVTRFPPEPNGYLHIGHAKAICLNMALAKKYNGICNLRFDDTNPSKEDDEFVQSIRKDMEWLGWSGQEYYASDYFMYMIDAAKRLIQLGLAYCDNSTAEQIKSMRGDLVKCGVESECRNSAVEVNLDIFDDMINGKYAEGEWVLRAKIDMTSPNINMRDPVIYRIVKATHHRQSDKFVVYPMYDFAHPIEDAVEGVTHSCCSLEFEDHRPLYDWVLDKTGYSEGVKHYKSRPHQYEFARLNIEGVPMSKRYLKKLVDDGLVDGWSDPRMPTISGLRRRGYTASSIRKFCDMIGVAKSNSTVDIAMLCSCIRDELNLAAVRVMAVFDPIRLVISNRDDKWVEQLDMETVIDGLVVQSRPLTMTNTLYIDRADFEIVPPPKYKRLTVGAMVRLKSGYIVKCNKYDLNQDGTVSTVYVEILEGTKSGHDDTGIKASGVIHWLNARDCKDIIIRHFEALLDSNGDFNKNSMTNINAKIESSAISINEPMQFLRHGYYCLDSNNTKFSTPVFNQIVGLKDSYK